MDYRCLLPLCETDSQRKKIEAVIECGSCRAAAQKLGINKNSIQPLIHRLRNRYLQSPEAALAVKGTSTLYDAEGNMKLQWVKTSKESREFEELRKITREMAQEDVKPVKAARKPINRDDDILSVYPLGDPHIGMYAWHAETGEDFDCDKAEELYADAIAALTHDATAKQALIINVGDFFHADNTLNQTMRSKHALDVDSRYARVLRVGMRIMKRLIDTCLAKHETVKVINAIGNHDDHSAIYLAEVLHAFYSSSDRVEIETRPAKFHYHQFGKVLLGVTHGDTVKPAALGPIMTRDCIDSISDTRFRVWHTGHIHHDSIKDYTDCVVESHRTLTPSDAWAVGQGYRSWRSMKRIDYHTEAGEIMRKTYSVTPNPL